MKLGIYVTVIAALAIAASPALKAQDMPEAQDMPSPGKPCKADREKFCPGLKAGDGKLGPCMKEHAAELSPECTAAAEAGQAGREGYSSELQGGYREILRGHSKRARRQMPRKP